MRAQEKMSHSCAQCNRSGADMHHPAKDEWFCDEACAKLRYNKPVRVIDPKPVAPGRFNARRLFEKYPDLVRVASHFEPRKTHMEHFETSPGSRHYVVHPRAEQVFQWIGPKMG